MRLAFMPAKFTGSAISIESFKANGAMKWTTAIVMVVQRHPAAPEFPNSVAVDLAKPLTRKNDQTVSRVNGVSNRPT